MMFGFCAVAQAQEVALPNAETAASPDLAPLNSGARVGAARALAIVDFEGKPLAGVLSEPAWETRGEGVFFTHEWGGTRNVWRAFPDPRDPSRYPRWRALPVTQFAAPVFARGACPLAGDRTLLMLSNATNSRGAAQVTLFDLTQGKLETLTNQIDGVSDVAPAPDGKSFAFATERRNGALRDIAAREAGSEGAWAVHIQNLAVRALRPELRPEPRLVERGVWHPAWQGADSLLVERVADGRIVRFPLGEESRRGRGAIGIARGTEVSASRDGSTLVLVGSGASTGLYLLAGDGSGLRALAGTEGAQNPALSGDGTRLCYVAPLPGASRNEARALWVASLQPANRVEIVAPFELPLPVKAPVATSVASSIASASQNPLPPLATRPSEVKTRAAAPVAQITGVQSGAVGTIRILGFLSGGTATFEFGQGLTPRRWEAVRLTLPISPGAPLLVWTPPVGARGVWSFRLTVTGAGGAARSLFSVALPLASRFAAAPVGSAPAGSMPAGGPLPSAPLPDLPAAPLQYPPPLPPLLPAPPIRELEPTPTPRPVLPSPAPTPRPNVVRPRVSNGDSNNASAGRDAATFNVSDTLAEMSAGQRVSVTFWALNRGTRAWDVSAERGGMVRLVTRWVRFEGGNRNGWTYQNMKNPVAPGTRTRWNFDLTAPAQPGRYKLIYALQRVSSNSWAPPAYNAPQETWPDEFAAIAFAVVVKPAS